MFTVNYACFFWAEQRLYSGVAAVLVATLPVWMFLAEWLLTRTALPLGSAVGFLLGIAGVVLVSRSGGRSAASHETTLASCVLLAGTLCWAAGSVWSRGLAGSRRLVLPAQQSVRAALQMTTGGFFLAILALGAGEGHAMVASLATWPWTIWLCFAYLIFASIVAFTAYVWLLEHEPASRVASYAYVNPLVALALGVGLAHEHISRWQVLGGVLVLTGVFATLRTREAIAAGVPQSRPVVQQQE
jgi:drug/metabolite transporter (DMT)-like permease